MEHGIICRKPESLFGYFGWGSVARIDTHTLVAACSGERTSHVCPFGKTELFYSFDDGCTWSSPVVVNDTVLDDRDAGIVHLGGDRLLLTWFNHPLRYCAYPERTEPQNILNRTYMDLSEQYDRAAQGSHVRLSFDRGFSWTPAQKLEVSSPHGPCVLRDGTILYLGKVMYSDKSARPRDEYHRYESVVMAYRSADGGLTWTEAGTMPLPEGTIWDNFHEPHAIELPSGRILGMIRFQDRADGSPYAKKFSMFQTYSDDGGLTWSVPTYTDVSGSPPHLLVHSSGAVICAYGRREEPFGERVMISYDEGATWTRDMELYPGTDVDLGYPASVELADGSILTVYYHKFPGDKNCSFLYTHWTL
ncbi:MAG: sialidase family protein [Clostridiaceae bacterium]|nr:sialidase family protein [Clostridiaceae bacterium]